MPAPSPRSAFAAPERHERLTQPDDEGAMEGTRTQQHTPTTGAFDEQTEVKGVEATAAATKRYVLHVTLRDGEELTAHIGDDAGVARDGLAVLHSTLSTERFAVLGDDTIVRSDEVRFVQLRESDEDEGGGLLETVKSKLGGGSKGMSTYEREDTEIRSGTGVGARRPTGGPRGSEGPGWADQFGYGRRPWAETKPFFMTSEFLGAAAMIAAVLVAAAIDDALDAPRAWLYAVIVAAAYIVSRGLAKSGTRDPNPGMRGDY